MEIQKPGGIPHRNPPRQEGGSKRLRHPSANPSPAGYMGLRVVHGTCQRHEGHKPLATVNGSMEGDRGACVKGSGSITAKVGYWEGS